MSTLPLLRSLLEPRLEAPAADWIAGASAEIADGDDVNRFCALLSSAARYVPRGPLAPSSEEVEKAGRALAGWNPERWTLLETARVVLVLSRTDLDRDSGPAAVEAAFQYADVGELCALYRSLAHMPEPERFLTRAKEGCRTNMTTVFEADVCDTPYPFTHFDDLAWRQALIKCVFIGSPLWRIWGLDERLSEELARMALDLMDERRSAGRPVQPDLWLCLGSFGGERALASIERELAETRDTRGRAAAAHALGRAGRTERLTELAAGESDPAVAAAMREAAEGRSGQAVFRSLHELETAS